MIVWNAIVQTLRQIRRNVLRSALTTLGILIGVAAVIAMIALGRGAAQRIDGELSGLGQNLIFVVPGTQGRGMGARITAPPFSPGDAAAIEREIPSIAAVAPATSRAGVLVYGAHNWRTTVTGSTNGYFRTMSWTVERGRAFTDGELRAGAPVTVIGDTVRRELFGAADPIGALVRVGNVSLRVVGTLASKGTSSFGQDQDDFAIVPLATHQRRISGTHDVDIIFTSARDGADTARVRAAIESLMHARRHVRAGDPPDYTVRDMKELVATVSTVTGVLTSLLAAIAAISLLVGGIGIMNIMLVAVSERTREIGIRLAIGARDRDVLSQFLIESVVLSAIGGLLGIAIGLGGSYLAGRKLGVAIDADAVLLGLPFSFSAAVGVIFGFIPARKAARMNPIDALRHE